MTVDYVVASADSLSGTQTLYTVPAGKVAIIHAVLLDNSDTAVQNLQSIDIDGTLYCTEFEVPPSGTVLSQVEGQFLTEGTVVKASGTGGNLSVRFSIKELTL